MENPIQQRTCRARSVEVGWLVMDQAPYLLGTKVLDGTRILILVLHMGN